MSIPGLEIMSPQCEHVEPDSGRQCEREQGAHVDHWFTVWAHGMPSHPMIWTVPNA